MLKSRFTAPLTIGALVAALALLPLALDVYAVYLLTLVFINVMLATSLRLSLIVGQLNISHSGFMAIGAYTSALLVMHLQVPFLAGLLCGGLLAMVASLIIGYPALRLRGVYFALVTVAFVEVIRLILSMWVSLTRGLSGLAGIPKPSLLGFELTTRHGQYYLGLALVLLTILILARLERSRIGLVWKGLGQADQLAESVGISALRYKLLAFAIGSFFAGVAGGFFAHYMRFIFPPSFAFLLAVNILIYNFVGGKGHILGPIVGATFLTLLSEPFRGITYLESIFFSVAMMLTILFLPGGLITLPMRLTGLVRKARYAQRTAPANF
ncbi:MAG TPA: branched-chain amino acid ABC transporter permease [Alphaproteobacteria bacterium]|nr:branched-chain amino acid ABC transporter permease [Alphaproteobacteria bacterium]